MVGDEGVREGNYHGTYNGNVGEHGVSSQLLDMP